MLILFFDFFIISKKMITKEIIMGASVFISANGYMRACACMFARACARGKKIQTKLRVFLRLSVAILAHIVSKHANLIFADTNTRAITKTGRIYLYPDNDNMDISTHMTRIEKCSE